MCNNIVFNFDYLKQTLRILEATFIIMWIQEILSKSTLHGVNTSLKNALILTYLWMK